ncbi:three-Cys-motif partner protein TcmP [Candidatus Bathyarchaeota archaeon]|nr:three-Cys-motif partner protein TcmP [Candidatus Bathyarchaeota archaeon]
MWTLSSIKEPIWDLDEHTLAKHEILKYYLGAWFPILARRSGRIVYIDGFAGPGIYSKGEEGSPIIALRTASEHVLRPRWSEVFFLFIENDKRRADILDKTIKEKFPELPSNIKYSIMSDEFEPTLMKLLDDLDKREQNLAPTFAFIDPFGFTGFSMKLMERLLSYEKCEVLITFMAGFMHRFLDELREPALDSLFGTPEWRAIREIEGLKIPHLLEFYEKQLQECCGISYTRSFEMIGKHNQVLYYMIFATKHWLGLKQMKESMWAVDRRGNYSFSDRLGRAQRFLIDYNEDDDIWIPNAADKVYKKFKNKTVPVSEIVKFVITETEHIFRKSILKYIEDNYENAIIDVRIAGRKRKGKSYPDDSVIEFG